MSILGHDGSKRPEQTVESEYARELASIIEGLNESSKNYLSTELKGLDGLILKIIELKESRLNQISQNMEIGEKNENIEKAASMELVSKQLASDTDTLSERLTGGRGNQSLNFRFVKQREKTQINGNPQHFKRAERLEHHQHSHLSRIMASSYREYRLDDSLRLYEELKIAHSLLYRIFITQDRKARMKRKNEFTALAD